MLNSTNTPKSMSDTDIKYKFIVIYDKFTKPMAVSLRNSISKEYTCAIWDKKVSKFEIYSILGRRVN